jgi:hypothetical protein
MGSWSRADRRRRIARRAWCAGTGVVTRGTCHPQGPVGVATVRRCRRYQGASGLPHGSTRGHVYADGAGYGRRMAMAEEQRRRRQRRRRRRRRQRPSPRRRQRSVADRRSHAAPERVPFHADRRRGRAGSATASVRRTRAPASRESGEYREYPGAVVPRETGLCRRAGSDVRREAAGPRGTASPRADRGAEAREDGGRNGRYAGRVRHIAQVAARASGVAERRPPGRDFEASANLRAVGVAVPWRAAHTVGCAGWSRRTAEQAH